MLCDIATATVSARIFRGNASPATELEVVSFRLKLIRVAVSPEKEGEVEGPLDQEYMTSSLDIVPVTLTIAATLLLGGFCSWNEKINVFIFERPLCVPERVPLKVLLAVGDCEIKDRNELFIEKLREPCELLHATPPIVAAKSPF